MRHWLPFILAAVVLSSCATAQPYQAEAAQPTLTEIYNRAIYEAAVYERENVRELRPLVPDANGEVLLASFTTRDVPAGTLLTAFQPGMWVTGVPEVREKCRQFTGDVHLQINQLLGLPAETRTPHVLVLRADIDDLFRPAPDASTSSSYPCPRLHDAPIPDNCGNVFPATTTREHLEWMAHSTFFLHQLPQGYPWTHLGYTYNWTPGADRYGASEYILRGGAIALVVENTTPEDYCRPPAVSGE
ncbi:MAG TPA: hypothetical protein VEK57_29460 [Thermoanaerobaculia bacterium]|nr:hypothetical protein [Thermoanaerobaculia bacterium]